MKNKKTVIIVGAGFGGLSAAAYLAKAGFDVSVYDKNKWVGGRAQILKKDGFTWDMGPSWYMMPEIWDEWFEGLGIKREAYYDIIKLDPNYKAYFKNGEAYNIFSQGELLNDTFESISPGSSKELELFLAKTEKLYNKATQKFLKTYYPNKISMIKSFPHLFDAGLGKSYRSLINEHFSDIRLRMILEYGSVFLGSSPQKLRAAYSMIAWADLGLGIYYPEGGFSNVANMMKEVSEGKGAKFFLGNGVKKAIIKKNRLRGVVLDNGIELESDYVIMNADYHWADTAFVPEKYANYSKSYWESRVLAPSTLNFYIGVDSPVEEMEHHTFFFDTDWDSHFKAVYDDKKAPSNPLFYIHIPSKTDPKTAPKNSESLFILIPWPAGVKVTKKSREKIFDKVCQRIKKLSGYDIKKHMVSYTDYAVKEYTKDYNSFKGNAFGLGHSFFQSASFRPSNQNKSLKNLFYVGHMTQPGTGTTPVLISGVNVANRIIAKN